MTINKEPLDQKKAHNVVPGKKIYAEATKFGKKICVIGDSHQNRMKKNIFQKSVNRGNWKGILKLTATRLEPTST